MFFWVIHQVSSLTNETITKVRTCMSISLKSQALFADLEIIIPHRIGFSYFRIAGKRCGGASVTTQRTRGRRPASERHNIALRDPAGGPHRIRLP